MTEINKLQTPENNPLEKYFRRDWEVLHPT